MQQDNSSFWTDIKKFEEHLAKAPDSFCFARLSDVYLKVGLVDDALHTARQGIVMHPGYLAGQRALAMACNAKGLKDECQAALKLVTTAIPEDIEAQKMLSHLLADAGEQDAARLALQTALEFFPDDVECRVELESLEFSGGLSSTSLYADDEIGEEIIEDLEIIEELEIVEELDDIEEDCSEFNKVDHEELPVVAPTAESHHDPLSTGTLAELYVKQGFTHKALEIYRSIQAEDPGNLTVSARITELEQMDTIIATENLSAVVMPNGTADNALATLEWWLDNIRRIKSCR